MAILDEEELSSDFKKALCDRLHGWELVEFLNISIEDIVELFEEDILDNLEDVEDYIDFGETDERSD